MRHKIHALAADLCHRQRLALWHDRAGIRVRAGSCRRARRSLRRAGTEYDPALAGGVRQRDGLPDSSCLAMVLQETYVPTDLGQRNT